MKEQLITPLIQTERLNHLQRQVFADLDISESTRKDYASRIGHFFRYLGNNQLTPNSFLEYKRYLSCIDTFSVSTKNKYLISAKVFLDSLYRMQLIPVRITDNIRSFSHSRLHKKDGLNDNDIVNMSFKMICTINS